jgi:hypothetical protein
MEHNDHKNKNKGVAMLEVIATHDTALITWVKTTLESQGIVPVLQGAEKAGQPQRLLVDSASMGVATQVLSRLMASMQQAGQEDFETALVTNALGITPKANLTMP